MKFCWSTLYVKNLEESIKFYEEIIGLNVVERFSAGPATEIAFLGEGETKVELICDRNKDKIEVGSDISWGFEVDSVYKMIELLKEKNIPLASDVIEPSSKSRFFFIKDPNGMKIQFYEHVK